MSPAAISGGIRLDVNMHEYRATLKRVVDGDTVWLRVDLGFRIWAESDFRLLGIDAAETRGSGANPEVAKAASAYLESLLIGKTFILHSHKPDKYGRWLATIYLDDGTNVNDVMISSGHAVPYPK